MNEDFLTEQSLGDFLNENFTTAEWVHDKKFLNTLYRPDYCSHLKKLVVEFDGYLHYTSAVNIVRDNNKDKIIKDAGYTIIKIPYFIQLSMSTIRTLFGIELEIKQVYPHGFISSKNTDMLPANFCELGIKKFREDLERFSDIKEDIAKSLKNKLNQLGDIDLVVPPSLYDLVR